MDIIGVAKILSRVHFFFKEVDLFSRLLQKTVLKELFPPPNLKKTKN